MEEELTLKEANYQVECWENDLTRLLNEKEELETMVDIHGISYDKVIVDGGRMIDPMIEYQVIKELKQLDFKIQNIQDKIRRNIDWIDTQLKILKKYNKVEQLIVYYKEIDTKEYTWASISAMVHYSERQCKRIYRTYKQKRDI